MGKAEWWTIYRFAATPKYVGRVEATSEKDAMQKAAAEFDVPEHERFRLTARRE